MLRRDVEPRRHGLPQHDPPRGRVPVPARKLQNPNDYTTKNSDCASCHLAKQALITNQQQRVPNDLDFKSFTFRLDRTHESIGPFRMFGWEQGRPVIAARMVNETANVLEFLNKNVMR